MKLAFVVLAGCSGFISNKAADTTLDIIGKSAKVAARESDVELVRAALPGSLLQLGAMQASYPDRHEFRDLHAEALCRYATAFVFDDWEDATMTGKDPAPIAERLSNLLDRCLAESRARLPADWTLAKATAADVPAMLAMTSARAVRIALSPMMHVADVPEIQAMAQKCIALAPGSHDAAAETLLAALVAGKAQIFGGPDGSAEFANARKLAPENLGVEVLFARTRKDRATFESTLNAVLAVDVTRWPEHRLVNELARRKAKRYLAAENILLPVQ